MQRNVMRFVSSLSAAVVISAGTTVAAHAQAGAAPAALPTEAGPTPPASPDGPPVTPASGAQPANAEPALPPAPPPPPPPPAHSNSACILGVHDGVEIADARTTAVVACEALQRAGANVGSVPLPEVEAVGYASAYRIEVRRLGYTVVLQEHYESPIGTTIATRSLTLNGVEEVPVAAPRIAESLLHGTPLEQTQKVTNLVGEDTRTYQKRYGETLFAVGVLGFALPGDTWAGYGIWGRLYYEAARYAVGLDLRIGGSSAHDGDANMVALSIGARYFLNEADISPFAGAGLGIEWIALHNHPDYSGTGSSLIDGSGLAAFGEVGVEFLRLHRSRFDVLLRGDAPFFDLKSKNGMNDRYRPVISLMGSYSFN